MNDRMGVVSILHKIIEHKKKEILIDKQNIDLGFYKKNISKLVNRDFAGSLKGKGKISLIAEVKKASPSSGIIKGDFDLLSITKLYRRFASCISVLTDVEFFHGSFDNLKLVRENTDLPILCKDFIIDEYQIYKARYYGADAILLIVAVLSDKELGKFYNIALDLKMDAVFEVRDGEELDRVLKIKGVKIIGINNRNLDTFEIDLNNTISLVQKIPKTQLSEIIIVSESGIKNATDVLGLKGYVDVILVGTSIVGAMDQEDKIYELTSIPKVKICGITNIEDASNAIYFGASYLGVILSESKRQVDLSFVKELYSHICNENNCVKLVGVFVNEEIGEIKKYLPYIDIIQLHGEEDDELVEDIRELTDKPIWKAIKVQGQKDLNHIPNSCDKILFDTFSKLSSGGTGVVFEWKLLNKLEKLRKSDIVLAGGINAENIGEATNYADILDISSGVEDKPGKKSKEKLKKLFLNLRIG